MEFTVKTKQLKSTAVEINGGAKGIKSANSSIESVIRNLDVGTATGEIRRNLRQTSENLTYLEAATSTFRRKLDQIAQQYQLTEKAILNGSSVVNPNLVERIQKAFEELGEKFKEGLRKGRDKVNKLGGDPVNLDTGNYIYEKTDLSIGGYEEFSFSRFYNAMGNLSGALGKGWIHNFEARAIAGLETLTVILEDGREEVYSRETGGYESLSGSTSVLEREEDSFRYTTIDGTSYLFNESGQMTRKENANKFGISFEYTDGLLTKAVSDSGSYYELQYSDSEPALLTSVVDHTGRRADYVYEEGRLISVVTGGQTVTYVYDRSGLLRSIINPAGIRIISNDYDEQARVMRQEFPDNSFITFGYDEASGATFMTERDGSESQHFHDELYRNTENIYSDGNEIIRYDEKNQMTYFCDRNGNETHFIYDNRGNVSKLVSADGTVITATYEKHNKPVSIAVNGVRKQKNAYDDRGNLLETIDGNGRKTSYKYNEKGMLTEVRSPGGRVISYRYDDRCNLTAVISDGRVAASYEHDDLNRIIRAADGNNNITCYEYDEHDNIVRITDPLGHSCSYTHNELNLVTTFTDFKGAKTELTYNELGKVCKAVDPLGRITGLEYDSMWNECAHHLPNGGTRTMEYDSEGRLISETDANGNSVAYERDSNGNIISMTDPEGGVVVYAYDELDRKISETDPEGNTTTYTYENNNLVRVCQPNGGTICFEYDAADQLVREINALGETREYTYTPDGDLESITDEAGRKTVYEYFSKNNPSRIVHPDGREETFAYDGNGNTITHAFGTDYTVSYEYDALDRVVRISNSNNEETLYSYDAGGNLISATDSNGNTTEYEYTAADKLCRVTDALGNVTEYEYDKLDMLTAVIRHGEGEDHTVRYTRDLEGNIISSTDALGLSNIYKYNRRGELTEKTDKDGYLTRYSYDRNGDLEGIIYNDGREVLMAYDPLRNLKEIRDWTGTTSVENDILGRMVKVTYPDNRFTAYTYGAGGVRTGITYPDGRTVEYRYDKAGRLSEQRDNDSVVRYTFNQSGLPAGKTLSNGLSTKYSYDSKGLLTGIISALGGEVTEDLRFAYDALGNKISEKRIRKDMPEESGSFAFEYDQLNRLTGVSRDGVVLRRYEYDAFGNRISLTEGNDVTQYRYNALDQLISSRSSRGTEETFRYDKRGNLIERMNSESGARRYSYNAANRIEAARTGDTVAGYEYNGLGHRIEEIIRSGSAPERKIRYTQDMTRDYNNLLERSVNGTAEDYLWDDGLLAVKGSTNHYYANDELGSPLRLISEAGGISAAAGYDEFGRMSAGSEAMLEMQPFGFTGYRVDNVAGTYFAQAREYIPEQGRFAAEDRINGNIWLPLSCNRYAYCWDNPAKYVDSDGNFPAPTLNVKKAWDGVVERVTDDWNRYRNAHYNRNQKYQSQYENLSPKEERALIEEIQSGKNGWTRAEPDANRLHRFTTGSQGDDAKYNVKYTKRDGRGGSYEIIICEKGNKQYIVRDPMNAGTYNKSDAILKKGEKKDLRYYVKGAKHVVYDMLPYFLFGNTGQGNNPLVATIEGAKKKIRRKIACLF